MFQWYDLSQKDVRPPPDLTLHPSQRNHRFFDSKGPGGFTTPRPSTSEETYAQGGQILDIDKDHIVQYAHFGYVYCMIIAAGIHTDDEVLISGGGDGTIKLWPLDSNGDHAISDAIVLENGDDSILTLARESTILYSGRLDKRLGSRYTAAHSKDQTRQCRYSDPLRGPRSYLQWRSEWHIPSESAMPNKRVIDLMSR